MRHPYEKFIHIEMMALLSVIIIGLIALIQGYLILIYLCLYLIALSLVCDALVHWYTNQTTHSVKQILRAILIFVITTYLLFSL